MVLSRRKTWDKVALVAGLLVLAAAATALSTHYVFSWAGNCPGAYYSTPLGLSLDHIVGYCQVKEALYSYVETRGMFRKVAPFGSRTSYLSAINRNGLAVGGFCLKGCNAGAGQHGYTYEFATGKIKQIDFPKKDVSTIAYGINDAGVVVGGYCANTVCPGGLFSPSDHGFVDDHEHFSTLDFPKSQGCNPTVINDAGIIVGFYDIHLTGPHAFLYQNGVFINIDFPGSIYTVPYGLNNHGVVSGLFENTTGVHGFIYYNGSWAQIDRPGAQATAVSGINDNSELVGTWNRQFGFRNFKAVPSSMP